MKEFKITTTSTCYTDYYIEATSLEEAEEKFWNGEFREENITDYANEEIIEKGEAK